MNTSEDMNTLENEPQKMNKVLVFWLAVLLLFAGATVLTMAGVTPKLLDWLREPGQSSPKIVGVGSSSGDISYDHGSWKDEKWIKEFTLTERSGEKFHSRDMEGKVWVVSYFFASCPTSCRAQNEQIKQLHQELGPQGVTFVSITCDPQRDTPSALRAYADQFAADPQQWLFLTGELLHLRRVGAEFFELSVDKETHSSHLVVIDKWGAVRGHFDWKNPQKLEKLKTTVAQVLSETEPPVKEKDEAATEPRQPTR